MRYSIDMTVIAAETARPDGAKSSPSGEEVDLFSSDGAKISSGDMIAICLKPSSHLFTISNDDFVDEVELFGMYVHNKLSKNGRELIRMQILTGDGFKNFMYFTKNDPTYTLHKIS